MCDIPTIVVPPITRSAIEDVLGGGGSGVFEGADELMLGKVAYREREVVPAGIAVVRTTAATAMATVLVVDAIHGPTASASILYVDEN